MTTVSSKTFLENPTHFFKLAQRESLAVKRGKVTFRIMPEPYAEDENFELSAEQLQILEERLQGVEDGTAVLIPHEEVMKELDEYLVQLKHERKVVCEYV